MIDTGDTAWVLLSAIENSDEMLANTVMRSNGSK